MATGLSATRLGLTVSDGKAVKPAFSNSLTPRSKSALASEQACTML